jgi:hypothetical protein
MVTPCGSSRIFKIKRIKNKEKKRMITKTRLNQKFVVVSADMTVGNAMVAVGSKPYLVVDDGSQSNKRYRIFVSSALASLKKTTKLKDATYGYRKTKVIPRSTTVKEANDIAIKPPNRSKKLLILVVDNNNLPMGILVPIGTPLVFVPEPVTDDLIFDVFCPVEQREMPGQRNGDGSITCVNAHPISV